MSEIVLSDVAAVNTGVQIRRQIKSRIERLKWYRLVYEMNEWPYWKGCFERDVDALQALGARLDLNPVIYTPPKVRRLFGRLGSSEEQIGRIFGDLLKPNRKERPRIVKNGLRLMQQQTQEARAREIALKIEMEILDKTRKGWYPIMNTLTVRAQEYHKIFGDGKKEWRAYLRRVTNAVGAAMCGSVKAFKRSDLKPNEIHTYCAVVESGGKTGRLHIHAIHLLRALPKNCVDPNKRSERPDRREINSFRAYWLSGFSTPIACRFHANDNFARANWRWPLKDVDGIWRPIDPNPPRAVAAYMADLTKAYSERRTTLWRTKMTRGFGTEMIKTAISAVKTQSLLYLMTIQETKTLGTIGLSKISPILVRRMATKELLKRLKRNELSRSLMSNVMLTFEAMEPRPSLISTLETITKENITERLEYQKTTSTEMQNLISSAISDIKQCFTMVWQEYEINRNVLFGSGKEW